jgi:hypothetical protein
MKSSFGIRALLSRKLETAISKLSKNKLITNPWQCEKECAQWRIQSWVSELGVCELALDLFVLICFCFPISASMLEKRSECEATAVLKIPISHHHAPANIILSLTFRTRNVMDGKFKYIMQMDLKSIAESEGIILMSHQFN